jgi:hypothetical protein
MTASMDRARAGTSAVRSELASLAAWPRAARVAVAHRVRELREVRRARRCDAMVLSRAKSGRTWVRAMLSRLYQRHHGLPDDELLEFDNFHRRDAAVPRVLFTHGHYLRERLARPAWRELFRERPVLFLVRHPCDVAVSEYFQSTRRASAHKRELYGVDAGGDMFAFVMHGPLGLPAIIAYLNAFEPVVRALPRSLVLRYEDLRAEPVAGLGRVASLFGAPFSEDEIREAVDFASFDRLKALERANFFKNERLAPRDPGDPDSFKVRRGVVGGYRDYFEPAQIEAMEALVRERLAPALGYGDGGAR